MELKKCLTQADVEENFRRILAQADETQAIVDDLAADMEVYITFDSQGGSSVPKQELTYKHTGTKPTDPTKAGHTFVDWFKGEDVEPFDWETPIRRDITLTAHWTANEYTVTFNPAEGTVDPTSKVVTYGQAYGTLPIPELEGNNFLGWFTDATEGTEITAESTVAITADTELFAHWEEAE